MTEILKKKLQGKIKAKQYTRGYDTDGVMFYNEKGENVAIVFDTFQQCYESFDYSIPEELQNDEVIAKHDFEIEELDFDEYSHAFVVKCYDESHTGYDGQNPRYYLIYCSNKHNGYYSHQVTLSENGEYIWEQTI